LPNIQLSDLDGFEVAARLARAIDPPAFVLTSTRAPRLYVRRPAVTPVLGFIAKAELSDEALAALGA
jgi:hypothetical protein